MYTVSPIWEDEGLDKLIEEALMLPVNRRVPGSRVVVKGYYQEELSPGETITIRPATDVEKLALEIDVVITVSATGTSTYNHKDMLIMLSQVLNLIETGYNGRSDTPVVLIRSSLYQIVPSVVKYFGYDNAVLAPIFRKIGSAESSETYEDTEDDTPDGGVIGVYDSLDITRIVQGMPEQNE